MIGWFARMPGALWEEGTRRAIWSIHHWGYGLVFLGLIGIVMGAQWLRDR